MGWKKNFELLWLAWLCATLLTLKQASNGAGALFRGHFGHAGDQGLAPLGGHGGEAITHANARLFGKGREPLSQFRHATMGGFAFAPLALRTLIHLIEAGSDLLAVPLLRAAHLLVDGLGSPLLDDLADVGLLCRTQFGPDVVLQAREGLGGLTPSITLWSVTLRAIALRPVDRPSIHL